MSEAVGPWLLDEAGLVELAGRLAAAAPSSGLVFLSGPLGAGKTTLVRAFLRALGVSGPVRSPTYTLIEPYELASLRHGGPARVLHLDLYRLGGADELEYLGLRDDLEQSLALIEWSERAEGALPPPDLRIELDYRDEAQEGRQVVLVPCSDGAEAWLRAAGLPESSPKPYG